MIKKQSMIKKPKSISSYSLNKIFKIYSCSDRKPPLPFSKPTMNHGANPKKKIKSTYLKIKEDFQTQTKDQNGRKSRYTPMENPSTTKEQKNNFQVPLSYRGTETVDLEGGEEWKKKKGLTIEEGREKNRVKCKIIRCSKIPFRIERRPKRDEKLWELFYRTEEISEIEYRMQENSMSSKSNILML